MKHWTNLNHKNYKRQPNAQLHLIDHIHTITFGPFQYELHINGSFILHYIK